MKDKKFVFLAGLHRSGTSLLYKIIKEHPEMSGFSNTGVPEDEGQHLQSVYPTAQLFGGPGRFVFDSKSHMNEKHFLATQENANMIFKQWSKYLDLSSQCFIEKSPPNIVKTRFLQKLYPNSKFIVILRHPIAVSYATQKWSKTTIPSLIEHTLLAYEIFFKDMNSLNSVFVLKYEDFVCNPQKTIDEIFRFLGYKSIEITHDVHQNINEKYFSMWEEDIFRNVPKKMENRAMECGYSLKNYNESFSISYLSNQKKNYNIDQQTCEIKISVVIPFYNTPPSLFIECILSVKKLKPFEIILVDDCSDNMDVVQIAKSSGCIYLKTPYQSGFDGLPFNLGVQRATGDYICRVDSDDVLLELPSTMPYDIHFGNPDRVNMAMKLTVEEIILAPRAILNAMVIKKEVLQKYPLAEDPNVFADVLLVLRLLYNQHTFDVHQNVNYIYRKREGSIQTSYSDFHHRLRHIQTVARFCQFENLEPKKATYFMELAMLNLKYGSKSRRYHRQNR